MNFNLLKNNTSNTNQALWVAIGTLSSFALGIVSAAILSRYFDKTEYGTYRQILYVYNSLLVVFSAGLPRVFAYFLPRYAITEGKDIVFKISKVLFLSGFVFSLFIFTFSGIISDILKNPELKLGLKVFSPIPMLLLPTFGIEGIYSTFKKTYIIALYNLITRCLMLLFIVLPVILFKGTYLSAIYGWIIVSIITLIMASYYKRLPFKSIENVKTKLEIRKILAFSFPLAFAAMAGMAIRAADQFYISRYFGIQVFAEFSNGFIELPLTHMITGAVSTVLMPVFSKMLHDNILKDQFIDLWQRALEKSAIIIYPLVLFFIFFAHETMIILYSNKYETSAVFFRIALIINFFNVIVFMPLLISMGESRFYARLHLYYAISAWSIGYFVVIIFKNPVANAIFSATQSICIILTALIFIGRRMNIKLKDLLPIGKLIRSVFVSILSLILIKFGVHFINQEIPNIGILLISFIIYLLLVLIASPLLGINYYNTIKPLFIGHPHKKK